MISEANVAQPVANDGPLLFARYAYPPNALGYCGPNDARALLDYASAGASDEGLRRLAHGFEGAWPYLRLIAAANAILDPLDARVVDAYWIGNRLLDRVDRQMLATFLEDSFARRAGKQAPLLSTLVRAGALPHHNFHVFGVYPWVGLLRDGRSPEPLRIIDSCRIRWGTVAAVTDGRAMVRSQPITWDGRALGIGAAYVETVTASLDGIGPVPRVRDGDHVAMHWDRICDTLTPDRERALRRYTMHTLHAVNTALRVERVPLA